MRLGLGNTLALTNNGSSNPDALSLNLDFATDKSFSKPTTVAAGETVIDARKGPSPVFYRASGGTMVGSNGLIQYSPENLFLYSNNFLEASYWATGSAVSSATSSNPDGTTSAFLVTGAGSTVTVYNNINITVTGNTVYTISVYVKAGTVAANTLVLAAYDATAGGFISGGEQILPTFTDVGGGWYRATASVTTPAGCLSLRAYVCRTNFNGTFYIWGAQVERSSTARQYIPTTTAVVYGPRFDHEPVGRTNWLANSNTPTLWNANAGQPIIDSTTSIDPFGSLVPNWKLAAASSSAAFEFSSSVTVAAGTYVFSVCAKRVNSDHIRIVFFQTGPTAATKQNVWFNLNTGAKGTVEAAGGGLTAVAQNITPLGDGWYRCSVSCTIAATDVIGGAIISAPADGSLSRGSDMVYGLAAAQLESGSVPTAFITTTNNAPLTVRICKGLLIEEQSANLAFYSKAIVSGTGWNLAGLTSTLASTPVSPDGSSPYEIAETASDAPHGFGNYGGAGATGATSVATGTAYTGSIFLRKVTGSIDWIQLTMSAAGFGAAQYANFNLSNGTAGNYAGLTAGTLPQIVSCGNGWYRCSITVTATATTSTSSNLSINFTNNSNILTRGASYLGSTANKVLANMCQFEAKAFPTSYIPTTTGSAPRSADLCSITGTKFTSFYNQPAGAVIANIYSCNGIQPRFNSFGVGRALELYKSSNGIDYYDGTNTSTVTLSATYPCKVGVTSTLNDSIGVFNGVIGGFKTSLTMPSPTFMNIGYYIDNTLQLNGCISSIKYYKKRLPDSSLIMFTDPTANIYSFGGRVYGPTSSDRYSYV